ncbi:MAG: RNA polymerase sigma factor [Candidatus Marinimicrobia bacterium]|nr:RNA polymerase sigma factor [Candidatus Neomarinimicrobiota bacterium]MBT3943999.1 RNA polymerase sigma factor [Candidatus Neomarinimicrobiota bacterium]MBT4112158.1 RNA polymerase sigma factor [Candidatus Neomarinimicrobiota bacterium]MBT4316737.1 RNA polymerase sigma factor [Candidatus Neomarinimicrobiota bacterium]MBT4707154.1 RNA polymerase sigma factor [Candidatus Neomarinimicrobiota bacterium]
MDYTTRHQIFMQAINTYGSKLYNISLFVLRNETLAEDSTQESFQKIWKSLDKFSFKSSLYTWMYRITYNTALTTYNKEKRHRSEEITIEKGASIDIVNNLSLKEAITKLPLNQRQTIIMFYFLDYSIKDIALELSINENTIKSWLRRAKTNLKDQLNAK